MHKSGASQGAVPLKQTCCPASGDVEEMSRSFPRWRLKKAEFMQCREGREKNRHL